MGRQKKRVPFTFRSPSHDPSGRHSVPSKEAPRPNFIFIEIAFNAHPLLQTISTGLGGARKKC